MAVPCWQVALFLRPLSLENKLIGTCWLCKHSKSLVHAAHLPRMFEVEAVADGVSILACVLLYLNCRHCLPVGVLREKPLALRVCRRFYLGHPCLLPLSVHRVCLSAQILAQAPLRVLYLCHLADLNELSAMGSRLKPMHIRWVCRCASSTPVRNTSCLA